MPFRGARISHWLAAAIACVGVALTSALLLNRNGAPGSSSPLDEKSGRPSPQQSRRSVLPPIVQLAGNAKHGDEDALRELTESVAQLTVSDRETASYMLCRSKAPVGEFLIAALSAGIPSVTHRTQALYRLGQEAATDAAKRTVLLLLDDPDRQSVASQAIQISGRWRLREAVPKLLALLDEATGGGTEVVTWCQSGKPPASPAHIMAALGQIGDPVALPLLERFLSNLKPAAALAGICREAIKAIKTSSPVEKRELPLWARLPVPPVELTIDGQRMPVAQAVPLLVRQLRSADSRSWGRAAAGLMRVGPELRDMPAYGEVKAIFADPAEGERRCEALRILVCAGGPEAAEALKVALASQDLLMRKVAEAIRSDPPPTMEYPDVASLDRAIAKWEDEVRGMLASDDPDRRMDALDEIRELGPKLKGRSIVHDLGRMFAECKDPLLGVEILSALMRVQEEDGREWYERGLADRRSAVRVRANELGASMGWGSVPTSEVLAGPVKAPPKP